MLGTTLHHRFRLEQVLHRAPSGPLYLATDERSGEMLAVKLFPPATDFAAEDGLRYLRAMERLAALDHPHLLTPRHTGRAEGVAFQVLPYYPGEALDALLAEGPLPPAQAAQVLRQLAAALAALYGAGLLHGNLKPANVLVARADDSLQAVLCDPLRPLLRDATEVCTDPDAAPWLAPEQVPGPGPAPDARADLYALGALALRMLSGAPPFAAAHAHEVLHQHAVARAPDARELNPAVPARLAAIVARLLAKAPRDRYQSAAGLLADLERWDAPRPGALGAADRHDPLAPGVRPRGREAAREVLLAALARAQSGEGTLVWLSGAPGSGRRTLVHDLLPHAEAARALLLRAPALPRDACAPFGLPAAVLTDLLDQWERLPDLRRRDVLHRLHDALGDNAAVLTGLVPALRTLLPDPGEVEPLPLGRERLRVLHTLCEGVLALGERRQPLVLWLEDAGAADPDSQEWLAWLARRLRDRPVLVLAGTEPQGVATRPLLEPLFTAPATRHDLQRIELAPLSVEQSAQWLGDVLGPAAATDAPAAALPGELAQWMAGRWGGQPLAQTLALRLLLAKGWLQPEAGGPGWRCDWEAVRKAAWPESLPALVQHRLELLPEALLPVLQALACAPAGCTFDTLAALLESLPRPLLLERVEGALAEGVVVRDGRRLRFAHAGLREAVLATLPPERRESLHLELGALLEAQPQGTPLERCLLPALHFRLGGDDARFRDHACALVAEAWRQQALRGLCHWAAQVQPLLQADRALADLLIASGIAHAQLENPERALSLLDSARALGLAETAALDAIAYAAWAERARGDMAAALARVEDGLALAGEALPANPVGTALARLSGAALRRYEALRQAAGGEGRIPLDDRERRIAELLALASHLLAATQPFRAALADERILRLAGGRAPSPQLVGALVRLGEAEGDPDGAPFAQARELLARHPFAHAEAAWHATLGRCRLEAGQWRPARDALETALLGFRRLGALPDVLDALRPLLELERLQGFLPRMQQGVAALRELALSLRGEEPAALASGLTAYAGALAGRTPAPEAGEALREAARRLGALGRGGPARYLLGLAAELALAAEDLGALLACAHEEPALPTAPADTGHALLTAALAEGHLAQAALLPEEATHHLQQARSLARELALSHGNGVPARADLARVVVLERLLAGDVGEAVRIAEGALGELDAAGLKLCAAWLRFRVAQGLKAAAGADWMRWGGDALTAFDGMGAALCTQAARRLLELEAPAPELPAEPGPAGPRRPEALLGLLERVGAEGALAPETLVGAMLAAFVHAVDAQGGAWFAPNRDAQLALAAQHPPQAAPGEAFNRWLAETTWREGRGGLLEHYLPPGADEGAASAVSHSLLCVPVGGGERPAGVVMLSSPTSRLVFDRAHLAMAEALAREAGALLALNGRLLAAREAGDRLRATLERHTQRLRWAQQASQVDGLPALLAAYGDAALAPQGCAGALLCLRTAEGLVPGAAWGAVPEPSALASLFPLPLAHGQAEAALARCMPVSGTALDAPPPNPAEQALLRTVNAGGALWLPVQRQGVAFGVVLALAEGAAPVATEVLEDELMEPLRLLAQALHAAWTAGRDTAAQDTATARIAELEREAALYARFLPPGLPRAAEALEPALHAGLERTVAVLAGEAPGLPALVEAEREAWPAAARRYFAQVTHGLALHDGALARVQPPQWLATYGAGADGALWGAQTLYELLLEPDDPAGDLLPPTGLGLHLGRVRWGAVPAGEARVPVLAGPGIRTAARLAAMSVSFRCGILVSHETVAALADPERFALRPLGRLRPAPGEGRIDVYELFSVRDPEVVAPMHSLQGVWGDALRDYQRGRWKQAAGAFGHYARKLPQDRLARYFLRQCRQRGQA